MLAGWGRTDYFKLMLSNFFFRLDAQIKWELGHNWLQNVFLPFRRTQCPINGRISFIQSDDTPSLEFNVSRLDIGAILTDPKFIFSRIPLSKLY